MECINDEIREILVINENRNLNKEILRVRAKNDELVNKMIRATEVHSEDIDTLRKRCKFPIHKNRDKWYIYIAYCPVHKDYYLPMEFNTEEGALIYGNILTIIQEKVIEQTCEECLSRDGEVIVNAI